jgi:hypothetical protein
MLNMSLKAKYMRSHEFGTAVAEYIEGLSQCRYCSQWVPLKR